MSQVARRTRAAGRMASDPRSYFAAHRVLSPDLPNHYPEYAEAKERLRKTVTDQEEEYQQTVQLVTSKLSLPPVAEARRAEIAGALLERCLAKGPGMTLTTRSDGYQYTVPGRTQRYSGGTAVAEDEGAAFAAFTAFVPEPDMVARCESLKKRAAGIVSNAEKLSADALVLAEQTTLPGECKYTKPE